MKKEATTSYMYNARRWMHSIQGMDKCCGDAPWDTDRVWYQRSATNSGVIYLFKNKPKERVTRDYSARAFGWLAGGNNIYTRGNQSGWCTAWVYEDLPNVFAGEHCAIDGGEMFVEFTDDISFNHGDLNNLDADNDLVKLHQLGEATDHSIRFQQWQGALPPATAKSASQPRKEEPMGTFDPQSAYAEQQRRLQSAKQGATVSLKDRCGTAVDTVVANNKTAAKQAAFLEAGRIANNQLARALAKHLPMMVRGYADTPLGKLVIANVAVTVQQHFKPNEQGLAKLVGAMTAQAYGELIRTAKIEEFIDSLLSDPKIKAAMTQADQSD